MNIVEVTQVHRVVSTYQAPIGTARNQSAFTWRNTSGGMIHYGHFYGHSLSPPFCRSWNGSAAHLSSRVAAATGVTGGP